MQLINELLLETSGPAIVIVSLIKATIVLAVAQLIVSALPRLSAATRHLLLTAGLAAFLVIPLLTLFGPKWKIAVFTAAPVPAVQQVATPERTISLPGNAPVVPESTAASAPPAGNLSTVFTAAKALTLGQIAATVWLLVSFFLVARLVRSVVIVRRIVRDASEPSARIVERLTEIRQRHGIETPVRVLQSERISVPMVWGARSGTLLLPPAAENWSDEELRVTMIHELGHLQRLDYVALTLMNLVSSLLWFHPQVWTARQRALTESERACDDLVLRAGERASEYASHLLNVARLMPRRDRLAPILAMSRPSQLEGRMYAILSTSVNRQAIGGKLLMSSLTGFMAVIVPLSMMQFTIAPAVAAPPAPAAMMASAAGPASTVIVNVDPIVDGSANDRPSRRSGQRSVLSRTDTGTCADYVYRFGQNIEHVRGEDTLTYSGRHLSVTAAKNGGVKVRRSTTGAFSITACKAAGGENEFEVGRLLSQISVQEAGGNVTVSGPDQGWWVVHLIVGVPDGHEIDVRAINGPLSITGVDATVSAEVQNGPLSLTHSRGEMKIRAVNGPLSMTKMSGNIDAAVKNGPLSLNLDDTHWDGGELRVSVDNGPLTLTVPQDYGSGVQVTTLGRGPFSCSLPECRSINASERDPRSWQPREINLGAGPARVFLRGGNGPVSIGGTSR